MNWIAQRIAREKALENDAAGLWEEAIGAIKETCQDFNKNYEPDAVEYRITNGHRIALVAALIINGRVHQKNIAVDFTEGKQPRIDVTLDGGSVASFPFDVDENAKLYITKAGKRISPDEFSQAILESPLFDKTSTAPTHSRATTRGSTWS